MSDPEKPKEIYKAPDETANLFSRITYSYFDPLLRIGYKKALEQDDLYFLGSRSSSDFLSAKFDEAWSYEITNKKNPSIYRALSKVCGYEFFMSGVAAFVGYQLTVVSPLIMGQIIRWINLKTADLNPPIWQVYVLAVSLLIAQLAQSLGLNISFERAMRVGTWIRTCLTSAVFKKAMKLSSLSRQSFSSGKIINIMSSDISRLDFSLQQIHYVWTAPMLIITAFGFLIWELGVSALAGLAVIFLSVPAQIYASKILSTFRKKTSSISDSRIKVTQEILSGIKVVKLYAWESSVMKSVEELRKLELKYLSYIHGARAAVAGFLQTIPIISCIVSFIVYEQIGNVLTAQVAFTSLALFYVLRFPLLIYPSVVAQTIDSIVALSRIRELLMSQELDSAPTILTDKERDAIPEAIILKDASFIWDYPIVIQDAGKEKQSLGVFTGLHNLNVKIAKGALVAVIGPVGGGKSSFVNALIGEMKRKEGEVLLNGSIAYCSQSAWLQNMTLRDNIIFGKEFDQEKYDETIRVCALENDLKILPFGDMTEIGERGINVSGGQKARISLARAVYSDKDIYLLDDPLSAVDAHVGTHLFEKCILGHLKKKTVVLISHRLHIVAQADYIILLDRGRIVEQGTYSELIASSGSFSKMMNTIEISEKSTTSHKEIQALNETKKVAVINEKNLGIIAKEERETGGINLSVYAKYINLCGGWIIFSLLILLMATAQSSRVINDLWLSFWIYDKLSWTKHQYEAIYGGIGAIQTTFMVSVGIFFVMASMRASRVVHTLALEKVLNCPMSWFDSQPLGRIINRFSKDMDTVDSLIVDTFRVFWYTFSMTLSIFVLLAVLEPFFLIPLIPILIVISLVQKYYRHTSVELKRLDNISRSPLLAHFSETLTSSGQATVRAFKFEDRFIQRTKELLDYNNRSYYLAQIIQRWLSIRLESLASLLVFFVALLGLLFSESLESGNIGIAITYALQVTFVFNLCIKQFAEMEMYMSSVERLKNYIDSLPVEAKLLRREERIDDSIPLNVVIDENWPNEGTIKFKDVFLRYREDLDDVIKGISFEVKGGDKVGIVGRTGAGKSSLIYALFLLTPLKSGKIFIDEVDIETLELDYLRKSIAIIPQDPVVFSGTIRSNLDPYNSHKDEELWECLERIGLAKVMDSGLQTYVSEGGDNWSAGQRQLICLARAMLKKCQILVLDEATASVDVATDSLIQGALREHFKGNTIVTIAHRINTVMDYEKIVVLEAGKVAEIGSPEELLSSKGIFHSMAVEQDAINHE